MFSVTHISVAAPAEEVRLQAELQELVAKSWWSRNLVTVNVDEMESKLQQADPIIKTVTINRQWPHALAATITLKQPSLGWSSGNQFYLVDVVGGAIGQLPPASKLPVVYDGSNLPVKTGDQVVSGRFVQFVTKLPAALSAQGLTATRFEVGETTLDLTVHTNKGFRLLFDTSRPVEEGTHDLAAVQKTLATQKKVPAEYIDLRIKGKAYYK
jgi:cell division septal protein FtsQ